MEIIKNNYIFAMFFCLSFICGIDISLQLDLVFTLQSPFSPTKKRYMIFLGVSVCVGLVTAISVTMVQDLSNPLNMILNLGMRAIFFVCAFWSLGLAAYNYAKGGLSRQYKNLLFKRHICFCILTIFCQGTTIIDYL